jgi:serine/threonine protein kinase
VYDISVTGGQHFLSMEYIDGEDLASLLRRIGRLPSDKALEPARQLCAGLAAAHDRKVLHRDLKPATVLIDGRGRAYLADFGLANLTDQRRDTREVAGTPGYMAPEQYEGRDVTTRTDVYAPGLVMYEMFTGKRAFAVDGAVLAERAHRARLRTARRPTFLIWIQPSNASSCGVSNATRLVARRRRSRSRPDYREETCLHRRLPPVRHRRSIWLPPQESRARCRRRSALSFCRRDD